MKQLALIGIATYHTFVSVAGIEAYREIQVEHMRLQGEIIKRYMDKQLQQQPSIEIRPGMRGA